MYLLVMNGSIFVGDLNRFPDFFPILDPVRLHSAAHIDTPRMQRGNGGFQIVRSQSSGEDVGAGNAF